MGDSDNREYQQMLRTAKLELKKSKRKNYYKILGIAKDAQEHEIKRAFKKAAMTCHPDKVKEEDKEAAEQKFKDINEAQEILCDPRKRQIYDSGRDLEDDGGGFGGGGGMDMDDLMSQFFQGGMGGGMRGGGFRFG